MKCDRCGREFEAGSMDNGMPNGIEAETQNGHVLTLCYYCVCAMNEKDGKKWLDEWAKAHDC